MKKMFLVVLLLALSLYMTAEVKVNLLDNSGHLQTDGYRNPVPVARYIQIHDGEQHLSQNTFAYHTKWNATNDLVDTAGNVVWTFADGDASILTQTNANQKLVCGNAKSLTLIYDIAVGTAPDGTVSCWLTGICDSTVVDVTVGTRKTVAITTNASASTGDFILHISSTAGSQGEITFDNMYLVGGTISPVTIANSATATFVTPVNAVELVIDPMGYDLDVKDEMGNYYRINTVHSIPCVGDKEITISNTSGASITLYFYYSML